jgi:hypothetical protein
MSVVIKRLKNKNYKLFKKYNNINYLLHLFILIIKLELF